MRDIQCGYACMRKGYFNLLLEDGAGVRMNYMAPEETESHPGLDVLYVCLNVNLHMLGCHTKAPLCRGHSWTFFCRDESTTNHTPADQIPLSATQVIPAICLGLMLCHINHSCDANCRVSLDHYTNTATTTVLRNISSHSELTLDYSVAGTYNLVFQCRCSSQGCSFQLRHPPPLAQDGRVSHTASQDHCRM
jgi:hypothetical protein